MRLPNKFIQRCECEIIRTSDIAWECFILFVQGFKLRAPLDLSQGVRYNEVSSALFYAFHAFSSGVPPRRSLITSSHLFRNSNGITLMILIDF